MHLGSGGCAVESRLFNIGIVDRDGDNNDDDDDHVGIRIVRMQRRGSGVCCVEMLLFWRI